MIPLGLEKDDEEAGDPRTKLKETSAKVTNFIVLDVRLHAIYISIIESRKETKQKSIDRRVFFVA